MAKLYFRYGAMNSGKSTALMQVAHNYEEQGMKVLILKPQVDTKGGGELVSRLGVRRKADLLIPPELDVFEAVQAAICWMIRFPASSPAARFWRYARFCWKAVPWSRRRCSRFWTSWCGCAPRWIG